MGTWLPGVPYTDATADQVTAQVQADRAAEPTPTRFIGAAPDGVLDDLDFTTMEPGPPPATFTDLHFVPGQMQDPMGILPGGMGLLSAEGDDYTTPGGDLVNGLRGILVKDYKVANVRARAYTDLTATGTQGGAGVVACNPDTGRLGVSGWNNGFFLELGYIAVEPLQFEYADMCWLDASVLATLTPADLTQSVMDFYVVDGWCWSEVNGHRVGGPIELPEGLNGSTIHGAQVDASTLAPTSNFHRLIIETWDGAIPAQYPAPTVTNGTLTKFTGTSGSATFPASVAAGDYAVIALASSVSTAPTTPTGFTQSAAQTTTGITLRVFTRKIDGTETWLGAGVVPLTVASGNHAVAPVRVRAASPAVPAIFTSAADSTADASTSLVVSNGFAGPHRASLAFVATAAQVTQTWRTGWSTAAAAGAPDIGLTVAKVADWSTPGGSLAPVQTSGAGLLWVAPAETVTLGGSARAACAHAILMPDPIAAPV